MKGLEYTIVDNTLTIKSSFLANLTNTAGVTLDFDINFDTGAAAMLTVNVEDTHMPSTDATVTVTAEDGITTETWAALLEIIKFKLQNTQQLADAMADAIIIYVGFCAEFRYNNNE